MKIKNPTPSFSLISTNFLLLQLYIHSGLFDLSFIDAQDLAYKQGLAFSWKDQNVFISEFLRYSANS